jgi:hypothetical protein
MARSRFVRPDVVTLPISNGDTITIRKQLNNGEQRALFDRVRIPGTMPPEIDTVRVPMAMIAAYLLDWTLTDDDGHRVEIRGQSTDDVLAIVDSLEPATVNEITKVIGDHVAASDAARAEEKKAIPTGVTVS